MGNEATKTKKYWNPEFFDYLKGNGIDIGCGNDPILPSARAFDHEHGDGNHVSRFVQEKFDYAFSSHSLEHMRDPEAALRDWLSVLKPGGYLVFLVPDEDLYEQGHWPSLFNSDHKHSFTISKKKSWSPVSVNVHELLKKISDQCEIVSVELQDMNFDYSLLCHGPGFWNRKAGRLCMRFYKAFHRFGAGPVILRFFRSFGALIDQTSLDDDRLCQIQVVLRKK